MARGVGSDPISTLAGRSAVYCKVQTISRPDLFKCVMQKPIQAAEIDQEHNELSLDTLNAINVTMGSWKRLLAARSLVAHSMPSQVGASRNPL